MQYVQCSILYMVDYTLTGLASQKGMYSIYTPYTCVYTYCKSKSVR